MLHQTLPLNIEIKIFVQVIRNQANISELSSKFGLCRNNQKVRKVRSSEMQKSSIQVIYVVNGPFFVIVYAISANLTTRPQTASLQNPFSRNQIFFVTSPSTYTHSTMPSNNKVSLLQLVIEWVPKIQLFGYRVFVVQQYEEMG